MATLIPARSKTVWPSILAVAVSGLFLFGAGAAEPARPRFRPDRLIVMPKRPSEVAPLHAEHLKSGRRLVKSYEALGGIQIVELGPGEDVGRAALEYNNSGLVAFAEPDYTLHALTIPNDPQFINGVQWSLRNNGFVGADIHATEGWDTLKSASNVVVAVVDSGVRYTHEDLYANMWRNPGEIPDNGIDDDGNGIVDDVYGYNAVARTGDPMDDAGHGTHVAGIIGAVGNNGTGIAGVAWNVKLMACKFLNQLGDGDTSAAIECIDYARKNGAQIINASWGGPDFSAALNSALNAARAAGIIVVTAAGNDAENIDLIPIYPACYNLDNIVVVGGTSRSDNPDASYSSYGATRVSLYAPGTSVYSTWYTSDSSYMPLTGTSMAAPHVAGVLALMKARFSNLTSTQLISRLLGSVDVLPALDGKCRSSGRLNMAKALGPNPTANFAASRFSGEPPLSVSFTNLSLGDLASVSWDFGDGFSATDGQRTDHVFARDGDFRVKLTVVGTNGRTNSAEQTIRVRSNYEFVHENYSWIDPTGMTDLQLTDNGVSGPQAINFPFRFYGQSYETVFVGANGVLGFATNGLTSTDNTSLPNSTVPNGIICPYWDNLNPASGGSVYAGVYGQAPNRKFVASWMNVMRNSSAVPLTFQAILEENTQQIVLQYLDVRPETTRGGGKRATVGIESPDGSIAALYTFNGVPNVLTNESALRLAPRSYDYLLTSSNPLTLRAVKSSASPVTNVLTLENAGNRPLEWAAASPAPWLVLKAVTGTLAAGERTAIVMHLSGDASAYPTGKYEGMINLTNLTDGAGNSTIPVTLQVEEPKAILEVSAVSTNSFSGGLGGPFSPGEMTIRLTNSGNTALSWSASTNAQWLILSATSGFLDAGSFADVTIGLSSAADQLAAGGHDATIFFQDVNSAVAPLEQQVHIQVNSRVSQTAASFLNGRFAARLAFPDDQPFEIEVSDDLENWSPLHTPTARQNGGVSFEDDSEAGGQRFYRIRGL